MKFDTDVLFIESGRTERLGAYKHIILKLNFLYDCLQKILGLLIKPIRPI